MENVVRLGQPGALGGRRDQWWTVPEAEWDKAHLGAAKQAWEDAVVMDATLPPQACKVARLLVGTYWDSRTDRCDPGVQTLCDVLEASERPVQLALRALVDRGFLAIERVHGRPSRYRPIFIPRETVKEKARRVRREREGRGELAPAAARRQRWNMARGIARGVGIDGGVEISVPTPVEIDGGGASKSTGEGCRNRRPNPFGSLESIPPLPPQGGREVVRERERGKEAEGAGGGSAVEALLADMRAAKNCVPKWWRAKVIAWISVHGIVRVREVVGAELRNPTVTRETLEDVVNRQLAYTPARPPDADKTLAQLDSLVSSHADGFAAQSGLPVSVIEAVVETAVAACAASGSRTPRHDGWARVRSTYYAARRDPGAWLRLLDALGIEPAIARPRGGGGLVRGYVVRGQEAAAADDDGPDSGAVDGEEDAVA